MTNIVETLWQIHNAPGAGYESQLEGVEVSLDAGQQLQSQLLNRWLQQGEQVGGWKIGMTSGASRNAMGDGIRPFGYVLKSRIIPSNSMLELSRLHRGQMENELCFLMGSPLGAGTTAQQARQAVAGIVPAFEINQKRLIAGATPGIRVADDLSNWGIVVGEPVPPQDSLSDLTVSLYGDAGLIEQVTSDGHIDNHYESLATLANTMAQYGYTLEPGQFVITGAYGKTPFAAGKYQGTFSLGIGNVEINLQ